MKTLAILQARMSSSRFPGKVLKSILGKSLLELQIERMLRAESLTDIVVATSVEKSDDEIFDHCLKLGITCFRGSLNDVLDRFYQTAKKYKADHVVRTTGDCPLIDPQVIDQTVAFYLEGGYDYANNTTDPTFPDGLDVEIVRSAVLTEAWKQAKLPSEREHVTPYIRKHPERYRLGCYKHTKNLSHLRWTVDEQEDFELVSAIYNILYSQNPNFTTQDILDLLATNNELSDMNTSFQRNEGVKSSKEKDRKWQSLNLVNSLFLQEKAKNLIPGMTQLLSKRPDRFSSGVWPGYYDRAKGVNIWDLDGNCYVDMSIGGIGANVLGYCDKDVDEAVVNSIRHGSSSSLNCPEEVELAEILCELHPWAQKVRYARTGGESMAVAVRIARASTGRDKIAFCGYHGWHDWYLSANIGIDALGDHLMGGLSPVGVPKGLKDTAFPFRYNRLDELKSIIEEHKTDLAAVVIEPIRNLEPEDGFLQGIRSLCDKINAVLIVDEISSGFRMNSGGAHLKLGLKPDIAVFSKALGNGYPIAAVIGKSEVMEAAQKSFISSTNWTERTGPTAAIAMIRKHQKENVGNHLVEIGNQVQAGWIKSAADHKLDIHVSGIPPLSHFSFNNQQATVSKAFLVQEMMKKGFLASTSFYSMFAHERKHVEAYLEAMDQIFFQLASKLEQGDFESFLIGLPSVAGFKRLS